MTEIPEHLLSGPRSGAPRSASPAARRRRAGARRRRAVPAEAAPAAAAAGGRPGRAAPAPAAPPPPPPARPAYVAAAPAPQADPDLGDAVSSLLPLWALIYAGAARAAPSRRAARPPGAAGLRRRARLPRRQRRGRRRPPLPTARSCRLPEPRTMISGSTRRSRRHRPTAYGDPTGPAGSTTTGMPPGGHARASAAYAADLAAVPASAATSGRADAPTSPRSSASGARRPDEPQLAQDGSSTPPIGERAVQRLTGGLRRDRRPRHDVLVVGGGPAGRGERLLAGRGRPRRRASSRRSASRARRPAATGSTPRAVNQLARHGPGRRAGASYHRFDGLRADRPRQHPRAAVAGAPGLPDATATSCAAATSTSWSPSTP